MTPLLRCTAKDRVPFIWNGEWSLAHSLHQFMDRFFYTGSEIALSVIPPMAFMSGFQLLHSRAGISSSSDLLRFNFAIPSQDQRNLLRQTSVPRNLVQIFAISTSRCTNRKSPITDKLNFPAKILFKIAGLTEDTKQKESLTRIKKGLTKCR